jgi:predicted dienelactone hydrolase
MLAFGAAAAFSPPVSGAAKTCLLERTSASFRPNSTFGIQNVAVETGPYAVKSALIKNVPGLSMGGQSNAYIYYPTDALDTDETYPFLSFAHGTGVGGWLPDVPTAYGSLLNLVASQGFIIMAPTTCPSLECFQYVKDQLATIDAAKGHPDLHPALANADFTNVGVFGHSMGGMSTVLAAGSDGKGYNIKAAVPMHPCWELGLSGASVDVPILFTAGSADSVCEDGCAYNLYNQVKKDKVFWDQQGATHFDPCDSGPRHEISAISDFLTCKLRNEGCDKVTGKAICTDKPAGTTMYSCEVA